MGNIDWIEIDAAPDYLKDGRPVLLANVHGIGEEAMMVGYFFANEKYSGWRCLNYEMTGIGDPTHFAEINAPYQLLRGGE